MVDEQHRFGTKQRQMLEQLGVRNEELGVKNDRDDKTSTLYSLPATISVKPHYLQFSATPIPRTQAMMESELVDVSLITTTPFEKRITTRVIGRSDFADLLTHIQSTIDRGEQVLIVYPLVEESSEVPYQSLDEARGFWEDRFERVFVTHGRDKEKEEVLLKFREEGDMLLATTVVEVGISLPRLTTIVIVGAERLGLATLHQLRGRVGRHGQESWCYLFSNSVQRSGYKVQEAEGSRHSGLDPESHGGLEGILSQAQNDRVDVLSSGKMGHNSRHSGLDPESHDGLEGILSQAQNDRDQRGHAIHNLSLRDKSRITRPLMRLQKFAQTTSGFEIAKLDLQYRDSGDILDGTIQSGQRFRWLDMAEDEEIVSKAKGRAGDKLKIKR
jgi:RecG-like helicase